jgi:hypothetical protein
MKRVIVFVEGKTEEDFVKNILYEHLLLSHDIWLDPRKIITGITWDVDPITSSRTRNEHKGGLGNNYHKARTQIINECKADVSVFVTTMFDLYALPTSFPKFQSSQNSNAYARVQSLEAAFSDDIGYPNFLPYLQLHEFEALLFTDVHILNDYVAMDSDNPQKTLQQLQTITTEFENPELINDSPETAPSKRLGAIFTNQYDKVEHGSIVAAEIGLPAIRAACPHFNDWLTRLESL